jgi:hypothetical protein
MNLYHLQEFGFLVRIARYVLDALVGQIEFWLPGSADSTYATLIGERGPNRSCCCWSWRPSSAPPYATSPRGWRRAPAIPGLCSISRGPSVIPPERSRGLAPALASVQGPQLNVQRS